MDKAENEDAAMAHVVDRLTSQFPGVPSEQIAETVDAVHETFDDAAVRDFVPVIVEHEVKQQLREAGNSSEPPTTEPA